VLVNGEPLVDGQFKAKTDASGRVTFTVVAHRSLDRPLVFRTSDPDNVNAITVHWFAP
jgi:hypothetical protein